MQVILVGASSLAREVLNLVRAVGSHQPIGFVDDSPARWGTSIGGLPVFGGLETVAGHPDAALLICVTAGTQRAQLASRLHEYGVTDDRYARMIHPSVDVARNCRVGMGSLLFAGVVMTSDVIVGRQALIMSNVTLSHGIRVHSFCTIAAGVSVGAGARIGDEATLGLNSSVRERVRVGRRSNLLMGSALMRDLPNDETWLGVPAVAVLRGATGHSSSESTRTLERNRV